MDFFNIEYWTLSALQPGKMAAKEETTVWNRVSTFVYALPVDIVGAPARRNGCRARDHWSRQKFNIEYWTLDIVGLTAWQDGCQRRDHCSRQGFNISCRKKKLDIVGAPARRKRWILAFVSVKPLNVFNETLRHFPAMFVATAPGKKEHDLFQTLT